MSELVVTLGEELRRIRELHKLTLRAVEGLTGISNAYLSQLETGKIEKPSPNYLYKLAEVYNIPYDLLMERAGYIIRHPQGVPKKRSLTGAALSNLDNLTPEEAEKVAEYLAFLRSQKKPDRL